MQEKLVTMGKNRSETIVYTVYLRQCYYELLSGICNVVCLS